MGDRYHAESLGGYDQGTAGRLPDKEPGRHRWIVIATYSLTAGQAAAAHAGARVNLDHENRIGISVGCLDCEGEYQIVRTSPCPAQGFDWYPDMSSPPNTGATPGRFEGGSDWAPPEPEEPPR